jgi:hypothetical protein
VDGLYLTIISILGPAFIAAVGTAYKFRSDSAGWKTSYEREKERADRQDRIVENSALATEMANKFADVMAQKILAVQQKAGQ